MQLLFIGDFLSEVFVGIIMVLDTVIYSLISSAYKIFMAIASARLLSSDVYYDIASRIYIVIGVLMLFVLSYAILKAIVDPDQATKGDLGPGMVKRVIIAVVGLAITPVLFNVLYQAQGLFLENDVLGKVFFRIENTESVTVDGHSANPDEYVKNIGGAVAATSIWQAFFHPAEGYEAANIVSDSSEYVGKAIGTAVACGLGIAAGVIGVATGIFTFGLSTLLLGGAAVALCTGAVVNNVEKANEIAAQGGEVTLEHAYAVAAGGGGFDMFLIFIDNYIEDDEIQYFWGVSTLCGAFALYAFASFSIDMGVRAAKLAYYQIIAPVPLVMQVLPKYKDTFGKYIKNVVSTFLEVFIRISVVYIVVYVICHLQDLFSSFGSLWGNESLNLAEKALALAFLILGLVIFAKSAPDIICQSLNIEKGSMKLGIGKKLADGGAYAAGGVAGAGITSAVRNWRDEKNKGFWNKARSAAAGFGSGAARAAYNQFGPGPGHKPAMTWSDMKNVSEKAAQGAADRRDRRDERQAEFASARAEFNAIRDEFDAAVASGAPQSQIDDLKAKMKAARQRMNEATAEGAMLDSMEKAIDTWSVGTVDLSRENADIKFATALNKTKDAAREEAFKKDNTTKALKTRYDELMAKQISEYRDGWDDDSYNEELRRRMRDSSTTEGADFIAKQNDYDAAKRIADSKLSDRDAAKRIHDSRNADLTSRRAELDEARRNGADAATIAARQAAVTAAEAAYNTALSDFRAKQSDYDAASTTLDAAESALTASRKVISDSLDLAAKRSDAELSEARMQLEKDRKAAKDKYEAAADAYVAVELAKEGSIVRNQLQSFISDNASYLAQNADRSITVGFDSATGEPIKRTVREIVAGSYGDTAINNGIISTDAVVQNNVMTVTDSSGFERTFRMEYTRDANGKVTGYNYVDEADPTSTFDPEEFFGKIIATAKKAEAKTRVTEASKTGKEASNAIPLTEEYMKKVTRKRQAEEGKK